MLSDLSATFDLETETIIGLHEDDIIDDFLHLSSEVIEDRSNN